MKVKYLRDVTFPAHLAGEAGDEKEIDDSEAGMLISGGYVETAEPTRRGHKKADDTASTENQAG